MDNSNSWKNLQNWGEETLLFVICEKKMKEVHEENPKGQVHRDKSFA